MTRNGDQPAPAATAGAAARGQRRQVVEQAGQVALRLGRHGSVEPLLELSLVEPAVGEVA